jgi:hypothetical protein
MCRQKPSYRAATASPIAIKMPKPIFSAVQKLSSTSDGKRRRDDARSTDVRFRE